MKKNDWMVPRIGNKLKKLWLMARFTICLLLIGMLSANANVFSQNEKVNLSMKNTTLKNVIWEIEKQTGFVFMYSTNDVNKASKLNISVENKAVSEVLENCLKGTNLTFIIQDKVIVIKPAPKAAPIEQKKVTIKGTVKDVDGNTLPGVSVIVKGTQRGVATNIDGKFEIMVDDKPGVVLQFSFVGMITKEVKIGKNKDLVVLLKSDSEQLEEVVITGFQRISKERASGSFDKVDSKELEKPVSSIAERLIGTVTGLQEVVDEYGNTKIEIRGQSNMKVDFGRQTGPLIVVDGFPIEGDFNSVNPNDIESVTVLKDAAAASIWGAKSGHGVIVITTKRGVKKGDAKVEFNSFWKFKSKPNLDKELNRLSSAEQIKLEEYVYGTTTPWGTPAYLGWYTVDDSHMDISSSNMSAAQIALNEYRLNNITEAEKNARLNALRQLNNTEQLKKYLLQHNITQQYNLAISGGNEKMRNRLSIMFEDRNSDRKGDDYKKYMVNYKLNYKVAKFMDFNLSGTFNYDNDDYSGSGSKLFNTESPYEYAKNMAPYQMLVNPDGSLVRWRNGPATNWGAYGGPTDIYGPNFDRYVGPDADKFPYADWTYNPIEELAMREYSRKMLNARINAGITLKLMKGLTFDSKFQYDYFDTKLREYHKEGSFEVRMRVNATSSWDRNAHTVTANLPKGDFLDRAYSETRAYNIRNQLNFNRTYGKHSINALAGTEYSINKWTIMIQPRSYGYDDARMSTAEFPNGPGNTSGNYLYEAFKFDWYGNPAKVYSQYPSGTGKNFISRFNGFRTTTEPGYTCDVYFSLYANAAYTYDDKYTFTASARTDASNLTGDDPSAKYSPFWSFGGSWQLGKEQFMDKFDWLDRLIVRASYGFNGIVNKNSSAKTVINLSSSKNPLTGDYQASITRGYGNPELVWEKVGQFNFAIDYSILQGKLYGKLEYYNKKSKDLIGDVDVPLVVGTSRARLNALEMQNTGYEIELGSVLPIMGEDIVWSGNLSLAYNKNKMTKLLSEPGWYSSLIYGSPLEGYDANSLWTYKFAGMDGETPMIYDTEGNIIAGPLGWSGLPGGALDYSFYQGTRVAPYIASLRSNLKIFDFDLSVMFTGKFGHKFLRTVYDYYLPTRNKSVSALYREAIEIDPSKGIPMPTEGYVANLTDYSGVQRALDYRVADASHIRFQEINLTYNMPNKYISKYGIKNVRLYGQVNNVARILFNSYDEDPEYRFGNRRATFTFGMKCNF